MCFLFYNLIWVSILSMSWWIVTFLYKFGSASHILSTVLSMLWFFSESSLMWSFFCQYHFPWDIFILFITTTFLIYIHMFTYTKLIWVHIYSLEWQQCQHSQLCSSVILFMFDSNFPSIVVTSCSFSTLSSLLASSFFQLSIFANYPMDLSLGVKEATQLHALLSVESW